MNWWKWHSTSKLRQGLEKMDDVFVTKCCSKEELLQSISLTTALLLEEFSVSESTFKELWSAQIRLRDELQVEMEAQQKQGKITNYFQ